MCETLFVRQAYKTADVEFQLTHVVPVSRAGALSSSGRLKDRHIHRPTTNNNIDLLKAPKTHITVC